VIASAVMLVIGVMRMQSAAGVDMHRCQRMRLI
jgi:hypothetical protein